MTEGPRNVPAVTVILPRVLAQMTGGERRFKAAGLTIRDALWDLGTRKPGLHVHFFEDKGQVRKHIICIHGEDFVRAPDLGARMLSDGDEIQVVNAVAGG